MIQCRTVYVMEMNGKRVERDELSKEVNEKRCQQKDGKWGNWRFVGIDGRYVAKCRTWKGGMKGCGLEDNT